MSLFSRGSKKILKKILKPANVTVCFPVPDVIVQIVDEATKDGKKG